MTTKPSKYQRQVKGVTIDVYDVLVAWGVTNPALQHAIKKLLQPGQRGAKDIVQDLIESGQAISRAIELEGGSTAPEVPSLYVYGKPGCGKTTYAGAIMRHFGLTGLIDDYDNHGRRAKITGIGELILGIDPSSAPKGIRTLSYNKAMNAVNDISERKQLLDALEALILFSKPTKTNAVALSNANIIVNHIQRGE